MKSSPSKKVFDYFAWFVVGLDRHSCAAFVWTINANTNSVKKGLNVDNFSVVFICNGSVLLTDHKITNKFVKKNKGVETL